MNDKTLGYVALVAGIMGLVFIIKKATEPMPSPGIPSPEPPSPSPKPLTRVSATGLQIGYRKG